MQPTTLQHYQYQYQHQHRRAYMYILDHPMHHLQQNMHNTCAHIDAIMTCPLMAIMLFLTSNIICTNIDGNSVCSITSGGIRFNTNYTDVIHKPNKKNRT